MKPIVILALLLTACAAKGPAPVNVASTEHAVSAGQPPIPADFVFGSGDRLAIKVWRHPEMDMEVTIAPDGGLTYPMVGRIQAAGMTYPALVTLLEEELRTYFREVSVAVNVVEVSNQKVFVLGEVQNPAVLQVENDLSIIEALTRTGGINPDARTTNVLLIRGNEDQLQLMTIDVASIYGRGDISQLVYLQRGDIVVVPPKTITNVERFFRRTQGMLAPFLGASAIYRNTVSSGAQGTSSALSD